MSRWVTRDGHSYPASLFEPPINPKPGDCPHCGGMGEVPETIDSERFDVLVPCYACRRYCKVCDGYFAKAGHECRKK